MAYQAVVSTGKPDPSSVLFMQVRAQIWAYQWEWPENW